MSHIPNCRPSPIRWLLVAAGAACSLGALAQRTHAQSLSWANAAGGSAATAGNWSSAQVPTAANDLFFPLVAGYTVSWNTVVSSRTHIYREGTVTSIFASPHTTSLGITIGDVSGDVATVILTTGTWNSGGQVTLGDGSGSSGTLNVNDDDADLIITGTTPDLFVGGNAPGTLSITGGGLVQVADQLIGGSNAASVSTITVSGATNTLPITRSTLNVLGTSQSRFGQGGDATVSISSGGLADFAGDLVVANGSASTSTVTVAGTGGLIPQNATLDVAGDLLLGRNTTTGSSGGAATMNVNADGRLIVGGTLFVAGDPDGGTATLHTAIDAVLTTNSLNIGNGTTLDLDGGGIDIDGGTLAWSNTASSPRFNGGVGNPVIRMLSGATATLTPTGGGAALVVGGGSGANLCDFHVLEGSDLAATGPVTLGEGSDDTGGMIINGGGSTMTISAGSNLTVGSAGDARFEAELGATVSAPRLNIAASAGASGLSLLENPGTTAAFAEVHVGGTQTGPGGDGDLVVNAQAVMDVSSVLRVWGLGHMEVAQSATVNAGTAAITIHGNLDLEDGAVMHGGTVSVMPGGAVFGPSDIPGAATLDSNVVFMSGSTLDLVAGDLTIGTSTSTNGFNAQDGSVMSVGAHTLTLHDANRALVDAVTINGGEIIAPNGLEIVTPGQDGRLDGAGTITASQVFFDSGGSVITSTGASGITLNGQLRNNSGNIDGTRYTFNDNPDSSLDAGWTGAGAINARVVFNSGTKVNALANMTMGVNVTDGVTFNLGSELHAGTRTVTLIDSNGIGLPSVTDFTGGHVVCSQPLVVNNGRRLSGRGGSVDAPSVTVFGRLSPGEVFSEPVPETGEMTINGALVLGANTDLDVDIGGYLSPIEFDAVVVNGPATLNGAINVAFVNGFNPLPGDRFIVMRYASRTGDFTSVSAPAGINVEVLADRVEVVFGCSSDFNQDGIVNSQDYFDFLTAFFCCNPEEGRADFNRDGVQNSQDYFDFLTAFFSPCR